MQAHSIVPLLCSVIAHVFYPDAGFNMPANITILSFLQTTNITRADNRYLISISFEHQRYNCTQAGTNTCYHDDPLDNTMITSIEDSVYFKTNFTLNYLCLRVSVWVRSPECRYGQSLQKEMDPLELELCMTVNHMTRTLETQLKSVAGTLLTVGLSFQPHINPFIFLLLSLFSLKGLFLCV